MINMEMMKMVKTCPLLEYARHILDPKEIQKAVSSRSSMEDFDPHLGDSITLIGMAKTHAVTIRGLHWFPKPRRLTAATVEWEDGTVSRVPISGITKNKSSEMPYSLVCAIGHLPSKELIQRVMRTRSTKTRELKRDELVRFIHPMTLKIHFGLIYGRDSNFEESYRLFNLSHKKPITRCVDAVDIEPIGTTPEERLLLTWDLDKGKSSNKDLPYQAFYEAKAYVQSLKKVKK